MDNGKVEAARKFMEAGLALPKASRALVTNALYLNLAHGTRLNVKEELMQRPGIQGSWETTFNFALDRYQRGDYEGAQRLLSHGKPDLANGLDGTPAVMRPDSLLLDGMLLFERGEIERAISRMDFIDVNFPGYRPYTSHFLAVSFFAAGSPEMAAAFFRKSVASGRSSDLLPQAMMEFDRGDLDKAFTTLNLARSQDSTVFDAANLESAKVQLANGDYFFAAIGLDESTVTVADWMQIGVAAGKRGNKAAALEAFRHATVLDSKNTAPYLEMARISLSLGDSLAMENLQPGLDLAPGDVALNVALAQILIRDGNLAAASAIVQDVQARAPQDRDVRILGAAFAAASGDTATAIRQFERLRKEYPIDPGVVVSLSRIYRAKRMDFEGQNMTLAAIAINPENPDLWYEMAHFERLLSRPEEAGANALQAMKRAANPGRSEQIAAEFKEEISSFKAQHLGEEVGKNGR
jgi:Tfp pilus assembly protein PilF